MHLKNIVRDELIGKEANVFDAKNPSVKGIKGKIIDETKSTLIIKQKNKRKRIFKKNITIKTNNQKIKGKQLFGSN